MAKTKFCQGISDISDSYSAFVIDQWGVLHNGEHAYEGAIECLKELKARKKHIIILSNSGKRAEQNAERLKELGIGPSLYDELVTSGEIAWQGLKDQSEGVFKNIGTKCFLMSRGGDRSIVDGLGLEVVDNIDDADFMMISGSDAPDKTMVNYYEPILKSAIRRRLKAICANPDSRALIGDNYVLGPGMIARRYEDFGGVVHYIGKPHKPIFQHCIRLLQAKEIYPGQTVMIGDTMAHDIIGAAAMDIDTCLVKNGIHYGAFKTCASPADVDRALNILVLQYHNIRPTYLVNRLHWGKALPDRKHKKRKTA
ncbi:MAG: TIGR01459 family HAD-type hydrolase [Alphaproteobacteria bacterium]|nr:TIGR01459 family HAD-type hydrolase [Alphaproteobacteria bacterium]MBU0860086.1 TIGR01459 family HAD-type hydrolase [Alphaproteobacteria bacterium]